MDEKEIKKYVEEMCKNIINLLGNHEEELSFTIELMKNFNQVCEEKNKLEQQVEKQQEAIEKSIKYIEKFIPIDKDTILMRERQKDYLLETLKEGKNE